MTSKTSAGGPGSGGAESTAPACGDGGTRELVERLRRTEQALRESEERFRVCTEATFEAIAIHDDGRVVFANDQLARMFGYTREEIVGKHGLDLLAPESHALAEQTLLDGSEAAYEVVARRKDGTTFPVEMRGKTTVYHGRKVRVTALWDITERKRMLDELHMRAERSQLQASAWEAVVSSIADGVFVLGGDGRVRFANEAAERICGAPASEMLHHSMEELRAGRCVAAAGEERLPPDDMPSSRALRGEVVSEVELVLQAHPSGAPRYIRTSAAPIRNAELAGAVVVFSDITDAKEHQAERERLADMAHRRAAELETVIDSMIDPVLVFDAQERLTLANRAALRLLGIERVSDAPRDPGMLLDCLQFHHLDGRPVTREEMPLVRALAGETVREDRALARLPGGGGTTYLERSAAPLLNRKGAVRGAVWLGRDVTEHVQLERLKEQFVRVAAHELKTPVAVMKGHAQLLLRRAPAELSPRSRRALEAINRGANRIDKIVQDLLDISQLQMGGLDLVREPVDLPALVREVAGRFTSDERSSAIRLKIEGAAAVSADRQRIESVIFNILDNALRYSPTGSDVDVLVTVDGDAARVCIHDRGVGIPRSKQGRIFERFYRAHTDTPYDYGGMGVGLFLSRAIVEAHGGRMWFESEEGRGSRFCFCLPVGGGDERR